MKGLAYPGTPGFDGAEQRSVQQLGIVDVHGGILERQAAAGGL